MAKGVGDQNHLDMMVDELLKRVKSGELTPTEIRKMEDFAKGMETVTVTFVAAAKQMQTSLEQAAQAARQFSNTAAVMPRHPRFLDMYRNTILDDLGTLTTPIVGYRDFIIGGDIDPVLVSRNLHVWPEYQEMRARCTRNRNTTHPAPEEGCTCGIYAYDKPDHWDLGRRPQLYGEVFMWGRVLICKTGYRAEYAYPKQLFMPMSATPHHDQNVAAALSDKYGIPVHLVPKTDRRDPSDILGDMINNLIERG